MHHLSKVKPFFSLGQAVLGAAKHENDGKIVVRYLVDRQASWRTLSLPQILGTIAEKGSRDKERVPYPDLNCLSNTQDLLGGALAFWFRNNCNSLDGSNPKCFDGVKLVADQPRNGAHPGLRPER